MWELKDVLLRYCAIGGSSRGVRGFVEKDLLPFAGRNPQLEMKTKIQGGHPCVFATYSKLKRFSLLPWIILFYIGCLSEVLVLIYFMFSSSATGYERQRGLKNMTPEEVEEVFQSLRDSLGRKTPAHNDVGIGVVEQRCISVQGVWRNTPELGALEPGQRARIREQRQQEYGVQRIVDEYGTPGALLFAQKLLERRAVSHQAALDALPKVERVLPSE